MDWPEKSKPSIAAEEKQTLGEGVFRNCGGCGETMRTTEYISNDEVCPKCGYHFMLDIDQWLELILDEQSFIEAEAELQPADPLQFIDSRPYGERINEAMDATGRNEAIVVGRGRLEGRPVHFGCFVFRFMGGSMGSVVGEKIARLFERASKHREPG
ncbi:MAG: hypothetical protein R3A47_04845 [Polyangiales bacterium]